MTFMTMLHHFAKGQESHALHFLVSTLGPLLFVVPKCLTFNKTSLIEKTIPMSSYITGEILVWTLQGCL